ncbi:MAG TPA: lipopolysaccharide heptosyltransferase II [Pyrinomonadaceae bacterium]|nr:lipopolysaccharide heptosyltransferase II [Pyrinomonadaceae bacterium]
MKRQEFQREGIRRVVVRGANWVGDAVMTVPALRELRRLLPGAHVTLATRPWAAGLFEGASFVDEIMPVEDGARSFVRSVRGWRRGRFDMAVLFPNAFAPALTAFAARVPLRVGHATDGRSALLTHPVAVPAWHGERHEVFYYLNVVAEVGRMLGEQGGHDFPPRPDTSLKVSAARRREALEFLGERGVRLDRPVVALCPGSTNSRAKRWPAERFAALADMLADEAGAEVVLVGAREEVEISREVASLASSRPAVLTGETDLARSVAVLSVADLLVTNDTGPAHIAAALGRPVVVVFGPTNPLTTRPYSDSAVVVRRPPECAPCMLRDCPIDHRCMTAVSAREVFERSAEALAARRAAEAVG